MNGNLYVSLTVTSFECLGVIRFIGKKKGLWLPIWNSYASSLIALAAALRNATNKSGDRGTLVLSWLSGGHFLGYNYKNGVGYWFEWIWDHITCPAIPTLLAIYRKWVLWGSGPYAVGKMGARGLLLESIVGTERKSASGWKMKYGHRKHHGQTLSHFFSVVSVTPCLSLTSDSLPLNTLRKRGFNDWACYSLSNALGDRISGWNQQKLWTTSS